MSDPPEPGPEGGGPDEEYARTYADGYSEGVRSSLREILSYLAHGHTVGELRYLVQSRIAQLPEEAERKRRTLLAAPPPSWRPRRPIAAPRPWGGPGAGRPRVGPGASYLVREPHPRVALELVAEAAGRFGGVALISNAPPPLEHVPPARRREFRDVADPQGPTIESLGGQIHQLLVATPSTLVYLDAIEEIGLHTSPELVLRFVQWLIRETVSAGGSVVAEVHPQGLAPKEMAVLEHSFQIVL